MKSTIGIAALLSGALLLSLVSLPSHAAGRVALVVGNGAYEHTPALRNPVNDAADVAAALKGLGFAVTEGVDLDRGAFEAKLREFARAARGAEAALFFYAGHGIQVEGENYLLPVDARLSEEIDLDFEALELRAVLRQMRGRANLVFLDACRDNPLAQDLARSMGADRSATIGRGLGRVDAGSGTLIAYATQPGNTAADGTGRNSPFTTALLRHIAAPGRSVNDLLTAVTGDVAAATDNSQQPWTHSSLRAPFYFAQAVPEPEPAAGGAPPAAPPTGAAVPFDRLTAEQLAAERLAAEQELLFWETVKDSANAANVQAYLDRWPDGPYAVLAHNLLEQLAETAGGVAPPRDMPARPAAAPVPQPDPEGAEAALGLWRSDRRAIQAGLASLGFDPGPADGLFGGKTRAALSAWQAAKGQAATGWLTAAEAGVLKAAGEEALRARAEAEREAREAKARAEPAETAADSRAPSEPASDAPARPASPRDSLHQIVQAGDIDGLNAALKAGADVNTRDKSGWSPLMHAASSGYTLMVPPLLSAQADVNTRAADGATALFMAVLQGHEEIATMLVQAGADISIRGPRGRTPLEIAQLQNLDRILTFLRRADADRAAYAAAVEADTAERYIRYIRIYPNGLFTQEAKQRRDVARDREAFQRAQAANTTESHRRYVKDYPTGRYRDEAERLIIELDTRDYNRAVNLDSAAAYQSYIASNPRGQFIDEATEKRKKARDREMFIQARSRNTIKAVRDYLAAHPEGAYRAQAQSLLTQLRNPIVFSRAQETHTIEAYTKYLEAYPDGEHATQAREEIAKLKVIGKEFRDCGGCPTMVVVPSGSFMMGSDGDRARELPRHRVTISQPFAVGKFEVTFAEFEAFVRDTGYDMGEKESFFELSSSDPCASRSISTIFEKISWRNPGFQQQEASPAVCINWNDAVAYAKWLSEKSGKPYRLLSEAEWEYVTKATTRTNFYFGNLSSSKHANYNGFHNDYLSSDGINRGETLRVGSFEPNEFGLHDLHGNVFEWTEDCWHENYEGAPGNGQAWTRGGDCSIRVIRGGSWFNHAGFMRSANRSREKVDTRYTHYGLRVARAINPILLAAQLELSQMQGRAQ